MTNIKLTTLETLTADALVTATGGCAACSNGGGVQQRQAPMDPGMAPPKYSAGWWDVVRGGGNGGSGAAR